MRFKVLGNVMKHSSGLKITAGQRTMTGQSDDLSGQNFGSAVILTSHIHSFQINNTQKNYSQYFLKFYSRIIKYHSSLQSQICRIQMRRLRSADLLAVCLNKTGNIHVCKCAKQTTDVCY